METTFNTLSATYTGMNGYALWNQYFVLKVKMENNTQQGYITVCVAVPVNQILNLNTIINVFKVELKRKMSRSYLKTPACFDRK